MVQWLCALYFDILPDGLTYTVNYHQRAVKVVSLLSPSSTVYS